MRRFHLTIEKSNYKQMKSNFLPILLTGLTLGTTWAIRGQFGHEQGAAWAGGIACIFLILFSKRKEWIAGGVKAALLGAIGWGMGGMMSYGVVVGYGRSDDYLNAAYGLLMLFIIGGLYGFIGGGLFGLGLQESSSGKKLPWHQLVVEMCAGALIFYYFVVEQLGILMTPPRSEAWGVCAGAAIAMAYFIYRNGFSPAMKVAVYSGLGAGFGFAFGNFLQVMGYVSEIKFNFWNVMEYSLGFFGGIGMAYGALTASFEIPKVEAKVSKNVISWSVFGLIVLIPFIVWQQSFLLKDLYPTFEKVVPEAVEFWSQFSVLAALAVLILLLAIAYVFTKKWGLAESVERYNLLKKLGIALFSAYLIYTFLITGSYLSFYRIEQFLYLINFSVILFLIDKCRLNYHSVDYNPRKAGLLLFGILVIILIAAAIAISAHGELPNAQTRF
jgi:hypothetical protein